MIGKQSKLFFYLSFVLTTMLTKKEEVYPYEMYNKQLSHIDNEIA